MQCLRRCDPRLVCAKVLLTARAEPQLTHVLADVRARAKQAVEALVVFLARQAAVEVDGAEQQLAWCTNDCSTSTHYLRVATSSFAPTLSMIALMSSEGKVACDITCVPAAADDADDAEECRICRRDFVQSLHRLLSIRLSLLNFIWILHA